MKHVSKLEPLLVIRKNGVLMYLAILGVRICNEDAFACAVKVAAPRLSRML